MTTTTKTPHRYHAIAPEVLAELRVRDDAGAAFHPYRDDEGGAPLRCCLRRSHLGEDIALVSYAPLRRWAAARGVDPGAYTELGPVFIHAQECGGPEDDASAGLPFAHTGARRVVRRYNADGEIHGGELVEFPEAADDAIASAVLAKALDDAFAMPDVALVHVRAVEYGCFLFACEPPTGA
ncbi:hypothetical protein BIV57_13895 [Mangrovactinospora gilvigrisea]|uniref:DUF1203 domain-containing protein n=1 Tax=Mangrovactinospora gilvigrisea TaxID=1428644 RepID=A0A1J7BDZ4_9ACTN|nr:DUF1203 domain-containing protein [Mangrovactinospora gilvigrisea]OIV36903.1 hypothetical protein BIV57_13895 [Mangrovactinospora gilvigrisea]